jgi:hypothetical protein
MGKVAVIKFHWTCSDPAPISDKRIIIVRVNADNVRRRDLPSEAQEQVEPLAQVQRVLRKKRSLLTTRFRAEEK